jgi:hypothetical protein
MNIKEHIKKHRVAYAFGAGIVVAGITCAIMRRNSSEAGFLANDVDAAGFLAKPQGVSSFVLGDNNSNIGNTTNNYGCKALSYIVSLDGTDRWWDSQAGAARDLGLHEPDVSKHLNHGKPLPNDVSLTRRGIAA